LVHRKICEKAWCKMVQQDLENTGSASQADWIEIANRLREGMKGKAAHMEGATPGEWYDFTRAVRDVMFIEMTAKHFDTQADKESLPWTK